LTDSLRRLGVCRSTSSNGTSFRKRAYLADIRFELTFADFLSHLVRENVCEHFYIPLKGTQPFGCKFPIEAVRYVKSI
jgi:hypothetical protein